MFVIGLVVVIIIGLFQASEPQVALKDKIHAKIAYFRIST